MFFNEDHLRITKIRTSDGISPTMGDDERPLKKIIFAPLNPQTKKLFEEENSRKPNQLKMKIEVVKAYHPEPVISKSEIDNSILEQRIKELEEQNKALVLQQQQTGQGRKDPQPQNGTQDISQPPKSTVKTNQHETV